MAVLVRIISNNAAWIYLACLLAALFLLRSALLARRERQQAAFKLEREAAINRTHSTLRWALLLLVVMGLTYFVANTLAVAVEPIIAEADPTPTPVFLLDTPTPTVAPTAVVTVTLTATETPTPRPRATPRPLDTPTPAQPPTPTAPAVVAPSCPDSRAVIIEPGVGQRVNGPVTLIGTAQSENFEYFKIEFKAAGAPGDFGFYLRRDTPVINGPLGTWNPAGLPAGDYQLRLVTVDITGNFGQCTVQVTVGG
ncbi:MAG TPA: hypothetical protein PKM78_04815 [Anaerolineae bacterium]|nr:hypothetical protein [Anaerolineae bacterium]HNU03115.1 hypothetical protein [Anaerolineae bacterium]